MHLLHYTTTGHELEKVDPGYLIKAKTNAPIFSRNPPPTLPIGYGTAYSYTESSTVLVSTGVHLSLPEGWYAILRSPGTFENGPGVNIVETLITHRDTAEIVITVNKNTGFDRISDGDVIGRLLLYQEPETFFVKKN